jgi:hypothetical protein
VLTMDPPVHILRAAYFGGQHVVPGARIAFGLVGLISLPRTGESNCCIRNATAHV